jgi:hypothetical protein
MYEQNARQFVELAQRIKELENIIHEQVKDSNDPEQWGRPVPSSGALGDVVGRTLQELISICNNLDLEITAAPAKKFCNLSPFSQRRYSPTYRDLGSLLSDINNRLSDELGSRLFISLSRDDMRYYSPREYLFGPEFNVRFANAGVFEVDEAAKCLALGRPTAAVFHLMRKMEVGIRAVARCLGISDPLKPKERSWANLLRSIKDGIEAKWPSSTDDRVLFEEIYASIDAVRNPWRNATMHVENKYTDDEAEHIFIAVKGFMKKLAYRCDENGDPKAL